jgi:hypothetical protein
MLLNIYIGPLGAHMCLSWWFVFSHQELVPCDFLGADVGVTVYFASLQILIWYMDAVYTYVKIHGSRISEK